MLEFEHKVGVKICGVTNLEDAVVCASAGADMIGLNFSPRSVRYITSAIGCEIIAALRTQFPKVKVAGVFLNQESALVRKIAADLTLDAIQLHGDESADYVRELDPLFVIKAFRVAFSRVAAGPGYDCGAILLDTWDRASPGGTGRTFPWSIAAALRSQAARLILAGGLTSGNVGEAIRTVRPFAVDVCSGVEVAPGRKDEAKVRAFVEVVQAVEGETNGQ